jgi:hypothetical protein
VNKYSRHLELFIALALAMLATTPAAAQECPCNSGHSGYQVELEGPSQPDLLLDSFSGDEYEAGFGNNVAACSGPFCPHACRSEGIYFSAESVFVDVWQPDGDGLASELLDLYRTNATLPAAPEIGNLDPDVDFTERVTLGWMTCDGLGVQVRYWEFDNAVGAAIDEAAPAPNFVTQSWDVGVFDVEVVKEAIVQHVWDTSLSGGYRFARYEEEATVRRDNTELTSINTRYFGNGITGAAGVRRQIAPRISLMANGRTSLLFGAQKTIGPTQGVPMPGNEFQNGFDARYILESQVGAMCEHPLCGGGFWYLRGGYEVQYWNDFAVPIGEQTQPGSTIFHGFVFAVGLQR